MGSTEDELLRTAFEVGQWRAKALRVSNHDPGDEDPNEVHPDDYGLTTDVIEDALARGREESDAARGLTRGRIPFRGRGRFR